MKNFLRFHTLFVYRYSCPFQNPRAIPPGISAVLDRQHRAVFTEAVGSSTASVSVSAGFLLASQQPSPGPHTALIRSSSGLPSYSLPSQKERKEKRKKDRITLKNPCKYKEKREKQTQIQLQLCECIWILAWVRRRKKGKKTR